MILLFWKLLSKKLFYNLELIVKNKNLLETRKKENHENDLNLSPV